jgi:hypothetical protein
MKVQARLKGEISNLNERLKKCITTNEANDYPENFDELLETYNGKVASLLKYKNAVMVANIKHNKFKDIIQLSELKNKIEIYKDLNIKIGIVTERYADDNGQVSKSQITISEKNERIQDLQDSINNITDDLDIFNASTDITI